MVFKIYTKCRIILENLHNKSLLCGNLRDGVPVNFENIYIYKEKLTNKNYSL